MNKEVTFKAKIFAIPENSEGASRILAHIAKPTNVPACLKKFRDYHLLKEGEPAYNNRSRAQVMNGMYSTWAQLQHSIRVGDWFDRMNIYRERSTTGFSDRVRKYGRALSDSLAGGNKDTIWKPYLPVAHLAAGFRIAMLETSRGRYFSCDKPCLSEQLNQIDDLIFGDHSWMEKALEAATARLVIPRLQGSQIPAITRVFIMTDRVSQNITPDPQNITPAYGH